MKSWENEEKEQNKIWKEKWNKLRTTDIDINIMKKNVFKNFK